jgi:hypothetical protein
MVTTVENTGKVKNRVEKYINTFYATSDATSDYETRRSAPRFPMADTVDIMLDSDRTPAEVILATGRDISLGGIGLYSHRPIPMGTEMLINIDNGRERLLTKAVAVHSTMSVGLFKVGARFII